MVSEVVPLYWKTNLNPGRKWHHNKFVCWINKIQRNARNGNDGSNASNAIALLLVLTQKINTLVYAMGENANEILKSFELTEEDQVYETVKQLFETHSWAAKMLSSI